MNNERLKVLELLEKGAITAEEATRLLDAVEEKTQGKESEEQKMQIQQQNRKIQGKMLRVQVSGDTEEAKNMNVNVSIPLVLARHVDNIIANVVPKAASEELKKDGVDLSGINLSAIVDTLEYMEEDIVQADIDSEDNKLKVRVYVE